MKAETGNLSQRAEDRETGLSAAGYRRGSMSRGPPPPPSTAVYGEATA